MDEKKLGPATAIRKFFAPIILQEIKEFKTADPAGYEEIGELCLKYYEKNNK